MRQIIQVHVRRGEQMYVAECVELACVTQAATLDELMGNVREAVGLALEGENLAELGLAPNPRILATYELE